jgi:hypothetical protein
MKDRLQAVLCDFIASNDKQSLANWLLAGFTNDDWNPWPVRATDGYPLLLADTVRECEPGVRVAFQTAVDLALASWRWNTHGTKAILELIAVGAYVGSPQLTGLAREFLASKTRHPIPDEESQVIARRLLDALLTQMPTMELRSALEWALNRLDRVETVPQVFLLLCALKPTKYHIWVPRLLDVLAENPSLFFPSSISRQICKRMSLAEIGNGLCKLDKTYRKRFVDLLTLGRGAPVVLVQDYRRGHTSVHRGQSRIRETPSAVRQGGLKAEELIEMALRQFAGPDSTERLTNHLEKVSDELATV